MGVLDKALSGEFFSATLLTFELTLLSMALGVAGGVVLALARAVLPAALAGGRLCLALPRHPGPASADLRLQRAAAVGMNYSPFACAVIALSLNEIAYMAEIVRGGLLGWTAGSVRRRTCWACPSRRSCAG
ncbi:hypothetical protein NKH77_49755 [Streptomyces sp. M19]